MLVKAQTTFVQETKVGILVDSSSRHGCGLSGFCDSSTLLLISRYSFSEFLYLASGEQKISINLFLLRKRKDACFKNTSDKLQLIIRRENEGKRLFSCPLDKTNWWFNNACL